MGNLTSCFYVEIQTAIIIGAGGNFRKINLPITAAEIMLDEPGHVVSQAEQIRRTGRIAALKADEELSAGNVYLLVPVNRANSKPSESEMALIESASAKRRPKRRSSKISPAATEGSGEKIEDPITVSPVHSAGCRLRGSRPWTPVLHPISE
ncbi:Protein of unknown function DUF4228, plant protein [Actinidia chinensis var. chinensis]|uniref:Uncharacterized protein n=1 Tax=Actinidia chinensis var. chinensis TaxID=1590841 RepID=A0A2R6PNT2_ACTCC|nr:Protein of unknown function DUF4228, plant protein [Actinidia chinensis var. chinensis]